MNVTKKRRVGGRGSAFCNGSARAEGAERKRGERKYIRSLNDPYWCGVREAGLNGKAVGEKRSNIRKKKRKRGRKTPFFSFL